MADRRELGLNRITAGALPVVPPTELRNPHEFLDYIRRNVTIETLLADRAGQARLALILDREFGRDQWHGAHFLTDAGKRYYTPRPKNPYPSLELESDRDETRVVDQPFMLRDGKYYYYFPEERPKEELPSYLRPEDLIPSGFQTAHYRVDEGMEALGIDEATFKHLRNEFDPRILPYTDTIPVIFNLTVHRMPTLGGTGERYNFNTGEWEESGDIWKPGVRRKARELLQSARARVRAIGQRDGRGSTAPAITS